MADTFDILRRLVDEVEGPPNWSFRIVDEDGALRLVITIMGQDNYAPERPFNPSHFHPVPIATYNEATWKRWIFEQCRRSMNHELGEQIRWGEDRPFAPCHGPGEDPYTVHEYRPLVDQFTTQNGSMREMPGLDLDGIALEATRKIDADVVGMVNDSQRRARLQLGVREAIEEGLRAAGAWQL